MHHLSIRWEIDTLSLLMLNRRGGLKGLFSSNPLTKDHFYPPSSCSTHYYLYFWIFSLLSIRLPFFWVISHPLIPFQRLSKSVSLSFFLSFFLFLFLSLSLSLLFPMFVSGCVIYLFFPLIEMRDIGFLISVQPEYWNVFVLVSMMKTKLFTSLHKKKKSRKWSDIFF